TTLMTHCTSIRVDFDQLRTNRTSIWLEFTQLRTNRTSIWLEFTPLKTNRISICPEFDQLRTNYNNIGRRLNFTQFSLLLYSTSSFFRVLAIKPTPDNTAKAAAEKIAYCLSSPVAGNTPTLLWSTSVFSRSIELPSSIVPSESSSVSSDSPGCSVSSSGISFPSDSLGSD